MEEVLSNAMAMAGFSTSRRADFIKGDNNRNAMTETDKNLRKNNIRLSQGDSLKDELPP